MFVLIKPQRKPEQILKDKSNSLYYLISRFLNSRPEEICMVQLPKLKRIRKKQQKTLKFLAEIACKAKLQKIS